MRAIITSLSFSVLAAAAVHAAEEPAVPVSGEASLATEQSGPGADNAKYREYWYSPRTASGSQFAVKPALSLAYDPPFAGSYVDVKADGRGVPAVGESADGSASIEGGLYGQLKGGVSYKRIGHTFAYDARTLYQGIGTGTLTLDDSIQGVLQNSSTAMVANNLNSLVNGTNSVYSAGASEVDLGLRRDMLGAHVEWTAPYHITTGVSVDSETRKGTRPYGGMFGFSNAIELAEPIDYRTVNVGAHATWSDKLPLGEGLPAYASLTYGHSQFTNNIPSLTYDNPLRLTQTVTGTQGRNALPPDNNADSGGLSLGVALPWTLRLAGTANVAQLLQNADFLPVTINDYLAPAVLALPRNSLEGKVVNSLYEGSLSARPAKDYEVKAEYAYRQHDNRTEDFSTPVVINYDSSVAGSATTENVSSIEREVALEQSYEVARRTTLAFKLSHGWADFVNGSANTLKETTAVLSVDTRALDWATFRVSGERGLRQADYNSATASDGENPWAEKFYAADRDRSKLTAMATLAPTDELTVSVEQMAGRDDYPASYFGLRNASHLLTSVAADYRVNDQVTVASSYTQETYTLSAKSRQWSPAGIGDPYALGYSIKEDPGNWTADSTDVVRTVGASSDVAIVPQKLSWRVEGQYTQNDGAIALDSVVGATPFDSNPFVPQSFPNVDATRGASIGTSLTYALAIPGLAKAATAVLGYRYDVWKINDYQDEGYTLVATNVLNGPGLYNSLLSMGTQPKDYEVHSVYLKVTTTF